MKVLGQGQKIKTKSGNISAIITGVCIRGKNIMYEVSYFSNTEYKQIWLYDFEFELDKSSNNIGFHNNSNDNDTILLDLNAT